MTWVFGYGSLMWRPGFDFDRRCKATLDGYHRAFSRLSTRHRGTPEKPGMVVALEPGGVCEGMAFHVPPDLWKETLAYLDEREGPGYRQERVTVRLRCEAGEEPVQALTYLPLQEHPTHVPGLPEDDKVRLIALGEGMSGTARDYLDSLAAELQRLHIVDSTMKAMVQKVRAFLKSR